MSLSRDRSEPTVGRRDPWNQLATTGSRRNPWRLRDGPWELTCKPSPQSLVITIANADVWLSIALALLLGCACLAFGTWVARTVGLLRSDASAGETLGVGLACGLIVLAAWWAALRSVGGVRSLRSRLDLRWPSPSRL